MIDKTKLPDRIVTERTVVRKVVPVDLSQIAAWPDYSGIYAGFSMTGR